MPFGPGSALGPYEIVEAIGSGGMGDVYLARDPRLDRKVAIKVVSPRLASDAESLERFEREARATAALNHPNIVTIFDVGRHGGTSFLVVELLAGETLRSRLQETALGVGDAVTLGLQLARGAAAAHALRIVHRDLKPENLFVTRDGTLKILDFGLAKLRTAADEEGPNAPTVTVTEAGRVLGTVAYMAPEQVRGEPLDERADLFSIGAILYEMLAGSPPFRGRTTAETMAAILRDDPPPLDREAAPGSLTSLVFRCLAKTAADRPSSARDVAGELESVRAELEGGAARRRPVAPRQGTSIAVLPFADMSPGHDQGYLCSGLAEELLMRLGRVAGLRIAARSSSFQFADPGVDLRAVGERLGVEHVLEGSVRKAGDRLRVTVQLVEVSHGYHRWSQRYDRSLDDIFALQDDIAAAVVGALEGVLLPGRPLRPEGTPQTTLEAYEYFLRGRQHCHEFRRPAFDLARRMFARALELDPAYAPAWAGLANAHAWLFQWWGGEEEHLRAADEASRRALELAPDSAETRAARGFILSLEGRYREASAEFREAIRLDPDHFDAHYLYARACFSEGRTEESVDLFRRASEIRVEDYQSAILLEQSLTMLGRSDEAAAAAGEGLRRVERRLELDPADSRALVLGSQALVALGQEERGRRWMQKAVDLYPDEAGVLINAGCFYAKIGEKERALDALEKAFSRGQGKRDWIENDPDYDPLRDDPRFQAMLDRLP